MKKYLESGVKNGSLKSDIMVDNSRYISITESFTFKKYDSIISTMWTLVRERKLNRWPPTSQLRL